ncbi:unnamed protein product [Penicillium nalgiovense]|uniref:Uncharacterized protein n=1 Tax=Penicillium nalgiovense TaxID=60175 RepID=A0A1V6Z647_PENNA|nr:hypothetical protein PENNAL_c0003G06224 [Penicillium nalgiovense]CAG7941825.1 unnamed protein product [Penicillium nalgiovense]CAG7956695.1 unnamed protein product [Penicillium nalgiovense]CAG7958982.1 unnamed protein product [Penicillium nalgiovense]CAG7993388.1 unnamed protein product [Penicillium nalgiovense]
MPFDKNNRGSRDRQRSPFRRASKFDHYDIPMKLPSPPQEDGPHPRHAIRPRSLADAYRDASKHAMSATYDDEYNYVTSPSPRSKRQPTNALSSISHTSPPPKELEDAYRRIDEDDALADLVRDYDWEPQYSARSGSRSRPPSSRAKDTNNGRESANGRPFPDAGFGDEIGDHRARKSRDYTKDEERLKRVTGQRSPVFSRAQVGRDALTADNLRRRMEDKVVEDHPVQETGRTGLPSPNIPTGWGFRAGHRQEWERNPTQRSVSAEEEEKARRRWSPTITETREHKPTRASPGSPARSTLSARSALEERSANPHMQATQEDLGEAQSGPKLIPPTSGGESIPNSPITVFKNSSFVRPSPSKRDSRDLLRKLSRTESPKIDQVQTPEPVKLFESKIYDKTPRVTGAWIDTPMTQRVAEKVELPDDLTKDIIPPRITNEPKEVAPPTKSTDVKSKAEEPKPPQTAEKEPIPEPLPGKESRPPLTRPHRPKSALETVIEDASSGKDVEFGDDTIESLQAFMDAGAGETKIEEDDEAYEKAVLAQLENADSKGNEVVDLDSLNIKLNSLMRHIDEVKKGLDGLEDHVTRDTEIVSQANSSTKKNPQSSHLHTGESCKGCGTQSDGRLYAAIPLPRLWKRGPRSQRLRPTKLGWFIIISLSWYIIECLMWDQYSHPEISESCEGYCLQPDAPVYPWVTVTMLWRWSHLSVIVTPIFAICVAFSRLVVQLMGLSDGYVDDAPELGNIIGEIRINGTPVAFPWLSAPTPQNVVPQPQQVHYTQPVQSVQPVWSARPPPPQMWDNDRLSGEDAMDNDEYV